MHIWNEDDYIPVPPWYMPRMRSVAAAWDAGQLTRDEYVSAGLWITATAAWSQP